MRIEKKKYFQKLFLFRKNELKRKIPISGHLGNYRHVLIASIITQSFSHRYIRTRAGRIMAYYG